MHRECLLSHVLTISPVLVRDRLSPARLGKKEASSSLARYMVRLFSHRIGTANWSTVEMGCYSGGYSCENSLLFHERGLILEGTRIVTRTWQYLLGLGTRFCEPRAWDAIKYRAVDGWKRFAPRINVVPTGIIGD